MQNSRLENFVTRSIVRDESSEYTEKQTNKIHTKNCTHTYLWFFLVRLIRKWIYTHIQTKADHQVQLEENTTQANQNTTRCFVARENNPKKQKKKKKQ